jgi:bifunctional non-homologous end joining protein LigD
MAKSVEKFLEVAGRTVRISNPGKVWFPECGVTKLDVVEHYLACGDGALRGVRGRPMALERYVNGATEPPFYQKRAPDSRPEWTRTVTFMFPSGRTAEELVCDDLAQVLFAVNLGSMTLHPHPVRADDLDHPDELRIDLDPVPGVAWAQVREVALVARDVLADHGLVGWPKTTGSRGMHILTRIEPRWTFTEVRRAGIALARLVERRAPALATSKWWKEERHGVFVDYNQNAKDRTQASAYSVRARPDARVSMPLLWDEVGTSDPAAWTVRTSAARFSEKGDAHDGIDDAVGDITKLLEVAAELEAEHGDAPLPPHHPKGEHEPKRVQPSRARKEGAPKPTGRRKSSKPVLVIAESESEDDAKAGLERWKAKYPAVFAQLAPHHVLIDKMRGRYKTWTRVRINLEAIPEDQRPPQEALDPDAAPKWEHPGAE